MRTVALVITGHNAFYEFSTTFNLPDVSNEPSHCTRELASPYICLITSPLRFDCAWTRLNVGSTMMRYSWVVWIPKPFGVYGVLLGKLGFLRTHKLLYCERSSFRNTRVRRVCYFHNGQKSNLNKNLKQCFFIKERVYINNSQIIHFRPHDR